MVWCLHFNSHYGWILDTCSLILLWVRWGKVIWKESAWSYLLWKHPIGGIDNIIVCWLYISQYSQYTCYYTFNTLWICSQFSIQLVEILNNCINTNIISCILYGIHGIYWMVSICFVWRSWIISLTYGPHQWILKQTQINQIKWCSFKKSSTQIIGCNINWIRD